MGVLLGKGVFYWVVLHKATELKSRGMIMFELKVGFENQKQTITAESFRFGEYGVIGKRLFELASCKPLPAVIGRWPEGLSLLIRNLYECQDRASPVMKPGGLIRTTKTGVGKTAVVAFTGGRDSVAVACMLLDEGYEVHLLHFSGLNRAHYREAANCERIADYLGVPLEIRKVKVRGRSGDLSNRFRNQFILCQQLDFAESIGASAVAQGNHQADNLNNVTRWIWFADARENYEAFQEAFAGGIEYRTGLCVNPSMVYATIARLRPDLLVYLGSCVHPHMYMDLRRKQTKEKWGVDMLPGRCGVCYKCCWEYLMLGEISDLVELDREYSLHCLDVVREKWNYFYDESLRPVSRLATARAIIDREYIPADTIMGWVEETSQERE